jgi:hypothetical protein
MIIFLILIPLVIVISAVYYFEFYKKGKINDRDGDYIPDEIEDTIEDVKKHAKEVKRRVKNVKNELGDVVDAAKGKPTPRRNKEIIKIKNNE